MIIESLEQEFLKHGDANKSSAMKAYMKGHFEFYGIPSPLRKSVSHPILKSEKPENIQSLLDICLLMWNKPQREWQYTAMEYLEQNKKLWNQEMMNAIEPMILDKSWWDSVDTLSGRIIAPFFKKFPAQKDQWVRRWLEHDNMWLRRISIIHQLKCKDEMNLEILTESILLNSHSNEFFLQKAIGWALREYAKTNPEWVLRFVEVNNLKSLSKREAVKNIRY